MRPGHQRRQKGGSSRFDRDGGLSTGGGWEQNGIPETLGEERRRGKEGSQTPDDPEGVGGLLQGWVTCNRDEFKRTPPFITRGVVWSHCPHCPPEVDLGLSLED